MELDRKKIEGLTGEYGGEYGLNHTRRLLHIISWIGGGLEYDRDVLWTAAYLHDWGGYPRWIQSGTDHAVRSRGIAKEFLENEGCETNFIEHVCECIEFHHGSSHSRSLESQLLSDADAIDFTGTIGVLREFSTRPRELRKAFEGIRSRVEKNRAILCLDKSKEIFESRSRRLQRVLAEFEEDAFGYY